MNATDSFPSTIAEVLTALGLSAGAAVALGLSRFCYALLLPAMRQEFDWSFAVAGALNTANGCGYIIGAVGAAWVSRRFGASRTFFCGVAISSLVLSLMAVTSSYPALFILRLIGGVSTAFTFIIGAGLAAMVCPTGSPVRRGVMIGIYVSGVGTGMVLAGFLFEALLDGGPQQWRLGWVVLGAMALLSAPVAHFAARRVKDAGPGAGSALKVQHVRQLMPTIVAYFFFGAGYAGYMTFVIALLQTPQGSSHQMIWFWSLIGLVAALSTLLWGRLLGSLPTRFGPTTVYATVAIGALLILLGSSTPWLISSALTFGGSFLAGPTAVAILVQRQLPQLTWTPALGMLTVSFASGQAIGPTVSGMVSDASHSLSTGLWLSPILLGAAAAINLLQAPPLQE